MQALDLSGVKVGVVIPCYKVERHIESVIRGIPEEISALIVVVDASPDGTRAAVEKLADPRVTLIVHERNGGVGSAMRTGFREALRQQLDIVVKMDGDDQMDPAHLARLLAPLVEGHADVTKCNRYSSLSSLKQMPVIRIIGNAGLTFLVKLASGYWNNFDPANGYVALRTSVIERLELERLPRRYFFESGLLIALGIQRAVVLDVAAPARYGDERSSLSIPRTLLGFPPRLLLGFVRRVFWRYFVHDFSAVSLYLLLGIPLIAFGVGYALYWMARNRAAGEVAPAGDVMLAAMPIILGVQLLLQAAALDIQGVPRRPLSPPLRRRPIEGSTRPGPRTQLQ
ncbi:MAG: glycosyltransferase family 2 protein [Planctomycetes bacterium]|nr:glycosyltransferase family 2 protein [Planctomycetota bacterium]